jgi:hypothetical protein
MTIDIKELLSAASPIGFTGSKGDIGFTGSQGARCRKYVIASRIQMNSK